MSNNLIAGFALAKHGYSIVNNLGFETKTEYFRHFGKKLGKSEWTIKNNADFFIPFFADNGLAGWWQIEPSKSVLAVYETWNDVDYITLLEYLMNI